MQWTRRTLAAAAAGAVALTGGAYVVADQFAPLPAEPGERGEPAQEVAPQPQAPAPAPAAQEPAAAESEQFEGRLVDVVQYVRGQEQAEPAAPAEFGAPPQRQGGAPGQDDAGAQDDAGDAWGDFAAPEPDEPGGGLGEPAPPPGAAQPPQPAQDRAPAPAPPAAAAAGPAGPVGLVTVEDGEEQLYILGIDDRAAAQPGRIDRPAPAAPPEPQQPQQRQQQEPAPWDVPGGGLGEPIGPPAQDQPPQRPAQDDPPAPAAPAAPPAGVGVPAGDGEVRTQADLERRIGEEVTLEGEKHERAGVEVIVVRRIEAERAAGPAPDAPGQAQPQQAPMPWLEQDADDQPQQQDADEDEGFDFDW